MRFQYTSYLFAVPFVFLIYFLWIILEKKSVERFSRFISVEMQERLFKKNALGRKKYKVKILCAAILFLLLALARPQMGAREETVQSEGIDLVFLTDVSNSMLTEDVIPSRLKKAKHIIRTFLEKMSGDRAGIVLFAGSAFPAVPLTTDYEFIKQTLEVVNERAIQNQGTNISKALKVSYDMIERGGLNDVSSNETDKGRVIVLISDGEAHSKEKSSTISFLKEKGITIYSIGVGSQKGGPIPLRDDAGNLREYKKDKSGSIVLSKLEPASLESLAKETGGKYFNASTDETEVSEILSEISGLQHSPGQGRKVIVYQEYFQYPLAIGVLLFFIYLLLSDAPKIKKKIYFSLIFFTLFFQKELYAQGIKEYQETKKGVQTYKEGDFAEAIRHFGEAQSENPDDPNHHLNLGDAFLKSGAHEQAVKEFEQTINQTDPLKSAQGAYNLGRAYDELKDHEHAIQSYQAGIDRLSKMPNPDSETLQKLKRALQSAQQQKQKSKNEDDKKDKKKDEQKDDKQKQNKDDDKKNEKEKEDQKQIRNPKPKFKQEKLSEDDAKRILKQLQEQEKKTQTRMMQQKTGKSKDEPIGEDW